MRHLRRSLLAGAALLWGSSIVLTSGASRSAPQSIRLGYEKDIRPLIAEQCLDCHSQDKRKGGLSLATYADILDGGKDGPIVRPGNGAGSLMIHRLTGQTGPQMPKDGVPLSDQEIAMIRRWIDEGARATPTSPPAPAPWDAPLALERPTLPATVWPAWTQPVDRIVASYLRSRCDRGAAHGLRRAIRASRVSRHLGTAATAG